MFPLVVAWLDVIAAVLLVGFGLWKLYGLFRR